MGNIFKKVVAVSESYYKFNLTLNMVAKRESDESYYKFNLTLNIHARRLYERFLV